LEPLLVVKNLIEEEEKETARGGEIRSMLTKTTTRDGGTTTRTLGSKDGSCRRR
jgi:hypothetical protein